MPVTSSIALRPRHPALPGNLCPAEDDLPGSSTALPGSFACLTPSSRAARPSPGPFAAARCSSKAHRIGGGRAEDARSASASTSLARDSRPAARRRG
ncbi:hypothetical protein K466DRAFT_607488 [Polyporus arcularius HHB13444]|uniref:Uncharacterized protein n=1 Tax=Polyporus arcularius HHB13444 TaxID=1314778 RepID=A0A5C3NL60_9APHY|nr:hypothetical protein K466DRAFT_607488 [Polyporus arcularius HHB13444]